MGEGFFVAVVYGCLIIAYHGYRQFDQPANEVAAEYQRLMDIIAPSQLRRRGSFFWAYAAYVACLWLVYFSACIVGQGTYSSITSGQALSSTISDVAVGAVQLPEVEAYVGRDSAAGGTSGFDFANAALSGLAEVNTAFLGGAASGPLAIALAFVGLGSRIEWIARVEKWVRYFAHRLVGIPAQLIHRSHRLRARELEVDSSSPLISEEDKRQLERFLKHNALWGHAGDARFEVAIPKLFAFREWVIRREIWPSVNVREGYHEVIDSIEVELDTLFERIDHLTAEASDGRRSEPSPIEKEQIRRAWKTVVTDVRRLADEVCLLLVIYDQRDPILSPADVDGEGGQESASTDERGKALCRLREFISGKKKTDSEEELSHYIEEYSYTLPVLLMVSVAIVSSLFGYFFGLVRMAALEGAISKIDIAISYLVTGLCVFAFPSILAIVAGSGFFDPAAERVNTGYKARGLPELVRTALGCFLLAMVGLLVVNIISAVNSAGLNTVISKWRLVLWFAVLTESPKALIAAVNGFYVAVAFDQFLDRRRNDSVLTRLVVHSLAVFAVGLIAEILLAFGFGAAEPDTGVLAKGGAYYALLGLTCGVVLLLTMYRSEPRRESKNAEPPIGGNRYGVSQS